jgi:enoyl-CoA hydratase/carnithine racemase
MTESSFLNCTIEDNVAFISIDRPPVNVLGFSHFEILCSKVLEFSQREDIRVIILMGNDRAFIAGFDIKEIASMQKAAQVTQVTMRIKHLMMGIEASKKPIIAGIRGSCFGGGLELILACHLRVATVGAEMGLPEINLATIPSFGGTVRLPKIIGRTRALELILTGRTISSEEAFRIGLINKVCRDEELFAAVKSLGRTIAEKGALAVQAAIQSTVAATEISAEHAMKLESKLSGSLVETNDLKESIAAYFERRKAVLKNS